MSLVKKPVTGMKDILPAEMQLRDYAIGIIKRPMVSLDLHPLRLPVWRILRT